MQNEKIKISGIDCPDCALHIEKSIKDIKGIESAKVDLFKSELKVTFESNHTSLPEIEKKIKSIGYQVNKSQNSQKTTFYIKGMDCQSESQPIEKALKEIDGINSFAFNLVDQKCIIDHDIPVNMIIGVIKKVGFEAKLDNKEKDSESPIFFKKYQQLILTIISGVFALLGLFLQKIGTPHLLTISVFLVAIAGGGYFFAKKGWSEARNLQLGMNFLMTIAVIGAIFIGEWSEAATVVFLFRLALLLESYSLEKARNSIHSLMSLTPKTALYKKGDNIIEMPVEIIKPGETIIIKPGSYVPLDGEVISGSSRVDEATITGESFPQKKGIGDLVFAGTINQKGVLEVKVTHRVDDTTLARIIHLVEEAQANKAQIHKFIDKFARYYTPAVVISALLIAIVPPLFFALNFSAWLYRALVLLVIACPCALVISTPITIVSGLTNASRHGILIKGGVFLEIFNKIKALAFDKTGTLTVGTPVVQEIIPMNSYPKTKLVQIAASIESNSEHPLAEAIVNYAQQSGIKLLSTTSFESITGRGVKAKVEGEVFFVGNHTLFEEYNWYQSDIDAVIQKFETQKKTVVLIGNHSGILGVMAISDALRLKAKHAIEALHVAGIQKTIMLTGDHQTIAELISKELGIDEYRAELLPQQKVDVIKLLLDKYKNVAMVGDGINDAPALATATIGISMGTAATDAALETADIALLNDDLSKIAYLKHLSSKTIRIIKQNIFIALFLKAVFFALALPGFATLWMAVFADMGASLIVIFNGLRTLKDVNY